MNDAQNAQERKYYLSPKNVYWIMSYYFILFGVGVFLFALTMYFQYYDNNSPQNIILAIIGCAGTSILGSVIYYIRKMYLICIHNNFASIEDCKGTKRFGTIVYFVIRPWFSMVICCLIVLGLSVGIFAFFISDGTLSPFFVNFSMVITFFLGISNGKLNDKIGKVGQSFISKLLD